MYNTSDGFFHTPMGSGRLASQAWDEARAAHPAFGAKDVEHSFREIAGTYYDKLRDVLVQKQEDYGPLNIAAAPGGAINGLLVRMNDKMQRLINLTYNTTGGPNNEAIKDSYEDLANYCVIALMVLDRKWEGLPE